MRKLASGIALAVAAIAVMATPAAAEFFGCNDAKTTVRNYSGASSRYASSRNTHDFSAQSSRPRFTFFSRQDRNRYR
jgi:predicted porin